MTADTNPDLKRVLPYYSETINESLEHIDLSIWQQLLNTISELFSAPSVLLNQANSKGIEVIAANQHKENPYAAGAIVPLECNIYCHHVVAGDAPLYVPDASVDSKWEDNPEYTDEGLLSYLGFPLHWPDGRVFGTLCVMDRQKSDYENLMVNLLGSFKDIIESQLALIDKNRQLSALSMLDEMTQLYNRRGLFEAAKSLIALASRTDKHLLAIYIDVDDLKPVNDVHGHESGDQLIKSAAQVIKTVMRAQDIAARVGGDEFVLLALVDNESASEALSGRLLKAAEEFEVDLDENQGNESSKSIPVSLSVGSCIQTVNSEDDLHRVIDLADKEMYKSKLEKKATRK